MKSFKSYLNEHIAKLRSGKYILLSPEGSIMGVFDTRHDAVLRQQELDRINHEKELVKVESNDLEERCWDGYKPTPGKKPYEKGSCMKEDDEEEIQEEAEHEGKKVTLNKPFRTPDGPKKFAVYVKNDKGNVVKVTFGDPNMEIKRDSDERRSNFRARHNCDDPGPKWKARYWSCKMWSKKPVSKVVESVTTDDEEQNRLLYKLAKKHFGKEVYDTDFNYSPNTGYSTFVINDRKVDVARSRAAKFHLTIKHLNDKEGYYISSFTPYYQGREVFYQEMYKFFLTHKTFADLEDALSFAKKVYQKEIVDPKRYKTHVKRFADENLPAGTKLKF